MSRNMDTGDRDILISELEKENFILKEKLRLKNEEFLKRMVERGREEEAIKKSRFILAKSQEMAHVGNWAWNVQTGELNGSDEAYRIYGYSPQEARPDEGWAMARAHPEDRTLLAGFIDFVRREGKRKSVDYRIVRPDGATRHVTTTADKVVRDRAGNIRWVYGITQDITERKLAEEEASQLASIVTSSDDAIIGKTLDGTITSWNIGAERLYGYTATEVLGRHIDIIVPENLRQELRDILERIRRDEQVYHYETVRLAKDGTRVDVSVTVSPMIDPAGRITGASTIARDITERKRAEAALQEKQEELEAQAEELESQTEELRAINEELSRHIEERKRAEAALRESEARQKVAEAVETERKRLFDVLETLPAMICLLTQDHHVAFVNRSFREKFGESHGRHCYEYCFGCTEPCEFCESYNVLKTGLPHHWEITTPDGTVIEAHDYPFTDVDGTPMILEMDIDVTEKKRAEAALHDLNKALEQRVADLREAEKAISAERQRFYDVLETLPSYLILLTPDHHVPFANRTFRERFGESHGRRCFEYLFGRTEPCENCESFKVLKTGAPHHWEWTGPDGRNYDIYDYPFKDTDGSPLIMEMGIDITERKCAEAALKDLNETLEQRVSKRTAELQEKQEELEAQTEEMEAQTEELRANNEELEDQISERRRAEEALRETSDYLESLVNYANAPIIVWDPDFRITRFNHAFERLTGYVAKEMVGRKLDKLFPPESIEESLAKIQRTLAGEHWESVEIPIRRKDGGTRIALWNSANVRSRDGKILRATIAQGQDITERKRAEEELIEAKSQAELYLDLMGHDISNMHQIAMSQLELAREIMAEEARLDAEDKELIDTPIETLERSAKLIDNVRKLQKLRAGEYKAETVDLGALLADVVREHSAIPDKDVAISYSLARGYFVKANPLLKDVFANLVGNAIKHSGGSATINIIVDKVLNGVAYYRASIEDNGPGIPDEKKEEVFHRFKRGQTRARGTGLGLYIVKTLVEGFNGRVEVEDRVPGDHTKGSRFSVYLPALEEKHGE